MRVRRPVLIAVATATLAAAGTAVYIRWERGDPFHVPLTNRSYFRFPCSSYTYVPPPQPGAIQAFGVIDGAALAARSNRQKDVRALVDAVFDRELPRVRCGSSFRRRVAAAEVDFRHGSSPPITEMQFVDAANAELAIAGAPDWARVSVAEIHLIREGLRGLLPRFVGGIGSEYQLSDRMTPAEAAFLAMNLGKGLVFDAEDYEGGPDAWVARTKARRDAPPPGPSRPTERTHVVLRESVNLIDKLEDEDGVTFAPANHFLNRLAFPP